MHQGASRANETNWIGSALAAAGLDIQNNQEHRRHQHEHQAGDEAEVVGFHRKSLEPSDRITANGA